MENDTLLLFLSFKLLCILSVNDTQLYHLIASSPSRLKGNSEGEELGQPGSGRLRVLERTGVWPHRPCDKAVERHITDSQARR